MERKSINSLAPMKDEKDNTSVNVRLLHDEIARLTSQVDASSHLYEYGNFDTHIGHYEGKSVFRRTFVAGAGYVTHDLKTSNIVPLNGWEYDGSWIKEIRKKDTPAGYETLVTVNGSGVYVTTRGGVSLASFHIEFYYK